MNAYDIITHFANNNCEDFKISAHVTYILRVIIICSSSPALPMPDPVVCITFDGPHPYGGPGDAYVEVSDVEIVSDPAICTVSGKCGYFERAKKAHLEIPYFSGIQFSQFAFR